jgi:hypothetical protein
MTESRPQLVGLGARVHLFVHPDQRAAFAALFRDVLGCEVLERDFGLEYPILLVPFGDGSAFSVEFTTLVPPTPDAAAVDDDHADRGAWIEFRTPEPARVREALRLAGVPEFRHRGSDHAYFVAPGGQVFRVLDVDYQGP